MKKVIRDSFTGIDNDTYDVGRIVFFLSFIAYFSLALISATHDRYWTAMEFAAGCGTIAASFGAMLRLKKPTEPEGKLDD